ncbi:hypothetical protein CH063_01433, partial [Colletotrichum higginsianum]
MSMSVSLGISLGNGGFAGNEFFLFISTAMLPKLMRLYSHQFYVGCWYFCDHGFKQKHGHVKPP